MVQLTDTQWAAVKAIVTWYRGGRSTPQVFYLAGYAGTGKSTIFRQVLQELRGVGVKKWGLITYTGKAAAVLRRKGNPEAQTGHSFMYRPPEEDEHRPKVDPVFKLWEDGPASEVDLIALDECSMGDDEYANDMLSFGKKTLVMGDPGQLPPVKGDSFFAKLKPDVMLTEVHRQALESPIIRLSILAREGRQLPFGEVKTEHAGSARVLPLNKETQRLIYREDTQPICGIHKVRKVYTQRIRHLRGFGGTRPMAGETLLCRRNNKDLGLFNGLQGKLLSEPKPYERVAGDDVIMSDLVELDVQMEDLAKPLYGLLTNPWLFDDHFERTEQPRAKKGVEWFDWGYLYTMHGAQGSEWPDVTVIDDSAVFREHRHRWRYVGLTRASEDVTFLRRE